VSDRVELTIDLTPEEHQQIEELAHQRGYNTPAEYVRALIEFAAEAQDETLPLADRFRHSLQDALAGKTYPISTLWDGLDDD